MPFERLLDLVRSLRERLPRIGPEPLADAHRIQGRASDVGFDWSSPQGALEKVAEELEEVRQALADRASPALEEELGDLLFAAVNLARLSGTRAPHVLQRANRKFTRRFEALERLAHERGVHVGTATLQELDALWDEVKARQKSVDDLAAP